MAKRKATSPKKPATESAPQQAPAAGATPIAAATAPATTEENPASTTRANDPKRDATISGTTAAEKLAGVEQPPNSNDRGAGAADGGRAIDQDVASEPTAGNRHSHPAETTAERTARISTAGGGGGTGGEIPAGDAADPANQPDPADGPKPDESSQDESGALQDATRQAIGAGTGAVDGVAGAGVDPSESEVNANLDAETGNDSGKEVEVAPGIKVAGSRAKLFSLLEKGATHDQMLKATGYRSALGTAQVLADMSGRALEAEKDGKGVKTYKLAPKAEPK